MNAREVLKDKRRIVIKVGSSSLVHQETGELDFMKIEKSPKMSCGTLLLVFSHQNQKTMRVINLAS